MSKSILASSTSHFSVDHWMLMFLYLTKEMRKWSHLTSVFLFIQLPCLILFFAVVSALELRTHLSLWGKESQYVCIRMNDGSHLTSLRGRDLYVALRWLAVYHPAKYFSGRRCPFKKGSNGMMQYTSKIAMQIKIVSAITWSEHRTRRTSISTTRVADRCTCAE